MGGEVTTNRAYRSVLDAGHPSYLARPTTAWPPNYFLVQFTILIPFSWPSFRFLYTYKSSFK